MKANDFKLAKKRRRRYPAQTITEADYADDSTYGKYTRRSRNPADKMKYMCFNQRGDIYTLNGSSQKLVGKFTNLGSSVSSTETDINMRLAKVWKANGMLLINHMEVRSDR